MMITLDGPMQIDMCHVDQSPAVNEAGSYQRFKIEFPNSEEEQLTIDDKIYGVAIKTSPGIAFVQNQIRSLLELPEGWDGYQSPAIDNAIAYSVEALISQLWSTIETMPDVVPTSSGGIQLEWSIGDRSLELEYIDYDTIHYLKDSPQAGIDEEDIVSLTKDWQKILGLILWLQHGD